MKIALLWPKGFDPLYVFPLAPGYLKSNLDAEHHEVRIFDCAFRGLDSTSPELRSELEAFAPDIVGVSCWSHVYQEALQLIRLAKSVCPNTTTLLGGPHPTSYPDAAMKCAELDFIFRGEAELSFAVFVDELESGRREFSKVLGLVYRDSGQLVRNEMQRVDDLDRIKIPDYDSTGLARYIRAGYRYYTRHARNAPIWFTRGCPYRCTFCAAPVQNGRPIRAHSIEYMVAWVKTLYLEKGIRHFNIIDDNFTFDLGLAKEFCRAMIALGLEGLSFGTPNGIRMQRTDTELLVLMRQAGWSSLCIAPESGSVSVLKRMKKDLDPATVPAKVRQIKAAGLRVHGLFIIGYPGETPDDLDKTIKLLRECDFDFFALNNFQPLPGTPIYDELVAEGEIVDGLLPGNYSDGSRVYTPPALRGHRFAFIVLREYVLHAFRHPIRNIPYMFNLVSPRMIASKVLRNLVSIVLSDAKTGHIDLSPGGLSQGHVTTSS